MAGIRVNSGSRRRQRKAVAVSVVAAVLAGFGSREVFMKGHLVDNINTLSNYVDLINQSGMNKRLGSRQRATLEALVSLFGGMKQAMRHQLQGDAALATAPMLLRMLQLCQRHPGITQQGLAQLTGRDKGQVARLVKELLDDELLLREIHPDDRRSHRLRPTAAGLTAVERFEAAEAGVAELIFGELSAAELTALTEQLDRLKHRLDERLAWVG